MKKKLTNTRVINSIGIGILAMVTAGTPVLAAINDVVNDNSAADTSVSDIPAEPVEQAAPSQNEQILQTLADTQGVIQEMVQAPEGSQPVMEGTGTPAETPSAEGTGTPVETAPAEGNVGAENINPPTPEDTAAIGDGSQASPEGSQTSEDGAAGDEGAAVQPPAEGEGTENPPADEGNGDVSQGTGDETPESKTPTVEDHLKDTADSLGAIINDIKGLEQKNAEAEDAVDKFKDAVDKPVADLLVDWAADAGSDAADAAESAVVDEVIAKDQAQIAVDAQNRGYASREEAEAARQQAQAAADAAEEAYRSAQAAVEEAEKNKATAGAAVEELKRLRDEAALALEEMNAKVGDAQERLRTILASYGFDVDNITPGSFDKDQLEGDAKKAYESAEKALEQAIAEQSAAKTDYDASAGEVKKAEEDFAAAGSVLEGLEKNLAEADNAKKKSEEVLGQEEYKSVVTEYNKACDENEKIKLELDQAKDALDQAKAALDKAQEVKNKSDEIVKNAEASVEAAESDEASKIEKAENAKAAVEQAIEENEKNINEALELAQKAEEEVRKAKEEANRAVECLKSVEEKAEKAKQDLDIAVAEKAVAESDYEQKLEAHRKAESALQEAIDAVLGEARKKVLEAQKKAESGGEEEKLEFAKALIEYLYSSSDPNVIKDIQAVEDSESSGELIVEFSDGRTEKFFFSETDDKGITIGQDEYSDLYSEEALKTDIEKYKEIYSSSFSDQQSALEDAKNNLDEANRNLEEKNRKVEEAKKIKDETEKQAAVVKALREVAESLDTVHENAKKLVEAEKNYLENFEKDKVNIVDKLESLILKRTDLDQANKNLTDAKLAKDDVEKAITELTRLTAQGNVDKNAYYNLVNAYNTAKADYDTAMDALDQCIASRNRAQTEKDRARAAANGVFRYITENNTGTVTPIQPGTLNPIYGTIIDSITSPIVGNTGVSAPSGTTGTGYTGDTYTIGGQPVYAVGETAADEEEPAGEELVSVEEAAVPLAEVGENNKSRTTNTNNTRKVSDEKIPLANVETENNKISWWWILVIAMLGATGTELYIRHQKKEEQERKAKRGKQDLAEI